MQQTKKPNVFPYISIMFILVLCIGQVTQYTTICKPIEYTAVIDGVVHKINGSYCREKVTVFSEHLGEGWNYVPTLNNTKSSTN